MSQIYPNIEAIYKVKDSRQMLLDRDNSIRTNFSGKNPPADVTTDDIGCSWFNTNDNLLYNLVSINPDGTNAVWQKNANFSSFNTMSLGKLTKELLFVDLEGDRCDAKQDLLVLVEHTILPSENYELTNDRKRVTFKTPIEAGLYVELRWFSKVIIGRDGKTFIPTISNKVLHWENDGQLPNPPDFDFGEAQKDVVVEGDNQEKRITDLSNQINSDIDKQKKSFDDNAIVKTNSYNSNAEKLFNDYNANDTSKTKTYNTNAKNQLDAYNTNVTKQLTNFNNNANVKTENFNANAVAATNKFNNNAVAETNKFNENTATKTNNFNSNAQTLTTAYNTNATQKENNLNKIFEEKQATVNVSVDKAKQSETNAKKAEEAANLSKNNAQESERKSRVWAEGTDQEVAELNGTKSSKGFMELTKTSEGKAKISETNAKISETNAKISEGKAKTSETNAKTSETNVKTSEGKAKTSETNAKASEDKAKISETNAQISETNAKASELKAEEYAALLSGVYKYRGTKPTYADLPKTKNEVGDVWDIQDTGKNFAWNGKEWDDLGGNLAGYATKEDLKSYQTNANLSQNLDTSTTKYPSNKAVKDAIDAKDSLPTQAGNNGKFLQTDGTTAKWSTVNLDNKQDVLSIEQLNATNSGITSSKVSKYDGYETSINDKASKTELSNGLDIKANKVDPTITGTITMDGARKIVGLNTINGVVAYNSGGNAIVNVNGNTASVDYISVNVNGGGNNNRPLVLQNESTGANVGIGTTVPAEKLEVVGNVKATKFIGTADKAIQDGSGNVITTTYATKTELTSKQPAGDYATKTELGGYLPLTGGSLDGNLWAKYVVSTWFQTTAVGNAASNTGKIAVIDGQGWIYYRTPEQLKEDIGAEGNTDQNTGKPLYDWVGTTAEYETQKVAATHPDWVCYITDDVVGIPDTYTKGETKNLLDLKANKDLSNTVPNQKFISRSISWNNVNYQAGIEAPSGTYTAPIDGVAYAKIDTTTANPVRVNINGIFVADVCRYGYANNYVKVGPFQMSAGDVITGAISYTFFPYKGAK